MKQMMSTRLFHRLEKIFFTLLLFLLTDKFNPFINFLSNKPYIRHVVNIFTGTPINAASGVFRIWWRDGSSLSLDVAFGFIILMLFLRPELLARVRKMLWHNLGIVALLMLACISCFWSIAPSATLNGVYLVVKITLVAIYISQICSPDEILDMLVWIITLASVLSILAIWLMPAQGISGIAWQGSKYLLGRLIGMDWQSLYSYKGILARLMSIGWQGIYSYKNYLGRLMAFGNAVLIVYWFKNRGVIFKQILALGLFILTGILLVFSDSATSLLVLMGMYGALLLYGVWTKWGARLNARMRSILIALGIIALIMVALNNKIIFALVNRAPTLTGRIDLWKILWTWFQKRPVFGFGYEAFWQQLPKGLLGWAYHAHNGYIEIALGLGLIGLIIFLTALVISWKRAFILLRQENRIVFFWPIIVLIFLTLSNITYSIAFGFPDFYWALFIMVAGVVTVTGPGAPDKVVLVHDLVDD